MFFGSNDKIYINNFSDRYGGPRTPPKLIEAYKVIFQNLGFKNVFDFFDLKSL